MDVSGIAGSRAFRGLAGGCGVDVICAAAVARPGGRPSSGEEGLPLRCKLLVSPRSTDIPSVVGDRRMLSEPESGADRSANSIEDGGVFVEEEGDVGAGAHVGESDGELLGIGVGRRFVASWSSSTRMRELRSGRGGGQCRRTQEP